MVKLQTIDFIRNAGTKKKAFAYRVPIGDYNYLQCKNEKRKVLNKKVKKFEF